MNAGLRGAVLAAAARGAPFSATPAKRARRRRQRANASAVMRSMRGVALAPMRGQRAPARGARRMRGLARGVGFSEAIPNENFEPSVPGITSMGGGLGGVLTNLGTTTNGQRWALKALHPNGEGVTAAAGIPDHTHVPVATPEYRSNTVITTLGAGIMNDDVDIVVGPFVDVAYMYRRYPSGSQPPIDEHWTVVYYAGLTPQTVTIPYTDSNTGEEINVTVGGTRAGDVYTRARYMYSGVTTHLDAAALNDQGRLIAGQIAAEYGRDSADLGLYSNGLPPVAFDAEGDYVNLGALPLEEDQLFQATPGAVVWEAREGCYLPIRFKEPVHIFNPMQALGVNPILIGATDQVTGSVDAIRDTFGVPPTTPTKHFGVSMVGNMLTGIILYRGIAPAANVTVKARVGLEVQLEVASPVSAFQHASPPLDQVAIDRVTEVAQYSAMAYPACYNDWSDILKVIGGIVRPIAKGIGGLGIPIVSDIAGGIDSIGGALGFSTRRRNRAARGQMLRAALRY